MDFTAQDLPRVVGGIEAVSLRQEVFERSALRIKYRPNRPIAAIEYPAWSATVCSPASVLDPSVPFLARHARAEIRQMKPRSRNGHRDRVRCVQAEKPHARFSIGHNVGSNIQFGKSRKPGNRRRPA